FDLALETKDTKYPAIHAFCSPTRKLGSDNADCVYLQAWIDGESVYKISGKKGGARFWNVTVQGPRPAEGALHEPFGDTPQANIFGHELKTHWDGSFELYIGGERQGQNWLPTTPGTRKLFLRQYFDRWDEEAASYRIERVGMTTPRPMPTPEVMMEAMQWASDFVYNVVDYWPDHLWGAGQLIDPTAINAFKGGNLRRETAWDADSETQDTRRGRFLTQMRWRLLPEQALVVEFDNFDDFWMITNEGMFGNSMDFIYRPVSYTPSRTAVDPDGKVRLVMAHADPGYANWIDTQAYSDGVLTFRTVLSRQAPSLTAKVVKTSELGGAMHPGARKAAPEERVAELHARFEAIRRRYRI
ncbi:MAG: DUF1214 domain-containing protein, partial [Caulobacteraceae bacterium]|nr:DUF1214 domain-containing protein [Caulobacteraceae bacterium]